MSAKARFVIGAVVVGVVATLPLAADNYILRVTTYMLMYSTLALSWNFIGGFAGYPSFATAAFFGLGAYAGGVMQTKGVPMALGWFLAGLLAMAFAAIVGRAILHLRGHYFAIGSLVIADVLREIVNGATNLTGGGMGLNLPVLKLDVTTQAQLFYAAMLSIAAATLATAWLLDRSRLGFGLRCIQQNEDAAVRLGLAAARYKTAAFALSGVYVGMAGAVYASWVSYIDPAEAFDVLISVKPIIMALLGGAGTVLGPVYGAFVFLVFEELVWRNFLKIHLGVMGVIVVLLILFLPQGLLGTDFRHWFRRSKPTPREST